MKISDILKRSHQYYIDWDLVESIPEFATLKDVQQSPEWHAEGNAWIHTKQVTEKALEFANNDRTCAIDAEIIVLSALFHDIGKSKATFVSEDGKIHSYGHEKFSDKITRKILWDEQIAIRESICNCVRLHMECHGLKKIKQFSAFKKKVENIRKCSTKFNALAFLHYCDVYGSNYDLTAKVKDIENADMLINYAQEAISLKGLYWFYHHPTSYVKVMIGLPGAGKSTYVEKFKDSHVVLSRDLIRAELGFCKEGEKVLCTKEQENQVTDVFEDRFYEALRAEKNVIIDNINLKKVHRDSYKTIASNFNVHWEYVYVQAPSLEDNYSRRPTFSKELFDTMLNGFDFPDPSEYDRIITIG